MIQRNVKHIATKTFPHIIEMQDAIIIKKRVEKLN